MLRIGLIDNLSARPYTLVPPDFPVQWLPDTPSGVYRAVQDGHCDAALLPVARLLEVAGQFDPAGSYGIACAGAVGSVKVYSLDPLEALIRARRPIHVTGASQTSRQLLYQLSMRCHGIPPVFAREGAPVRARLLIGDETVPPPMPEATWPHQRDLGAWWHEATRLPFVFARWVVRWNLPPRDKHQLAAWLEQTVLESEREAGKIRMARRLIALGLPPDEAHAYYHRVHARLDHADLAGLRNFLDFQKEDAPCRHIA